MVPQARLPAIRWVHFKEGIESIRHTAAAMIACAFGTCLIATPASAESDVASPEIESGIYAQFAIDIVDGRTVGELSDSELNALIEALPEAGGTIVVADSATAAHSSPGLPTPMASSPGICWTDYSDVYLRKSFSYNGVGVKPMSQCTHTAPFMSITTSLAKETAFGWKSQYSTTGKAYNTLKYTNLKVGLTCTNTKYTHWKAVSTHQFVTYTGRNLTLYSVTPVFGLKCGT